MKQDKGKKPNKKQDPCNTTQELQALRDVVTTKLDSLVKKYASQTQSQPSAG